MEIRAILRQATQSCLAILMLVLMCSARRAPSSQEEYSSSSPLAHEMDNCRAQISILERQVDLLETSVGGIRDEIAAFNEKSRGAIQENIGSFQGRIEALETKTKTLVTDISTVKNHTNELSTALTQCQKQLQKLESISKTNSDNIASLEGAMRSLAAAMQNTKTPKSEPITSPTTSGGEAHKYKVIAGDTLEKIARQNNTTVKALKDLNGLQSGNRIMVGQELSIP